MRNNNLLSRAEMKRILGGNPQEFGACSNDSQCPDGQWCCPDFSDPLHPMSGLLCKTPTKEALPDLPGMPVGTINTCPYD